MNLNDTFHLVTSPFESDTPDGAGLGTASFYHQFAADESGESGPRWRKVESTWLVTNRHNLLPRRDGSEVIPSAARVFMRRIDGQQLKWEPIEFDRDEFRSRTRFHPDRDVDIGIIDVDGLVSEQMKSGMRMAQWYGLHKDKFAGQNNIDVEASDDVLVVGYPEGYYDKVNLFPIIKAGIVASRWGSPFNGQQCFLIDAKLFPGSSGSVVVSKPVNIVLKNGQLMHTSEKQFAFLGIYSGSVVTADGDAEVGKVWYAHLIEEIIEHGVSLVEATT